MSGYRSQIYGYKSIFEDDYIKWRFGSKYLCLYCGNCVRLFRGRLVWDQVFAAEFLEVVLSKVIKEFLALNIEGVS